MITISKEMQNVIDTLENDYEAKVEVLDSDFNTNNLIYIKVNNGNSYVITSGKSKEEYDELISFIVNDSGLTLVNNEDKSKGIISESVNNVGPYRYIMKHKIGPGALPKDVTIVNWEELDDHKTAIWLNRLLTTTELKEYDIYPEDVQESYTVTKVKEEVELTTEDLSIGNNYPSLIVALESEKDAEITYKSLIEIEKESENPNQEVITLLEKILTDELEHIALLSALSASEKSEFVGDDAKEDFDDIIDSIPTENKPTEEEV